MEDAATQGAPAPEPQSQPQSQPQGGGGFSIPDGHRLVPNADWEKASRHAQQYEGSKGLLDAAIKHGFKDASTFEEYGKYNELLRKRGFNGGISDFMRAIDAPEDDPQPQRQEFDLDALRERGFVTKEDLARAQAEAEHKAGSSRAEQLRKDAIAALTKDVSSKREKSMIENTFENLLWRSEGLAYGDDHPLKGQVRPFTERDVQAAVKAVQDMLALDAAEEAVEVGKAASKSPPKPATPPAGSSGGQGKPSNEPKDWRQRIRDMPEPPRRGQPAG